MGFHLIMLLTLATRSLQNLISGNGDISMSLFDLPDYAMKNFELRGLNVPASMLSGWTLEDMDRLRDRGDKAGCPCLVLIEDTPLKLADKKDSVRLEASKRIKALAVAANRLGCNALAIQCQAPATSDGLDLTASELKIVMPSIERTELNLLIAPSEGLTSTAEGLTDLLKRVGGFRVGSLPDFEHSAASGDLVQSLRALAPYAGSIHATINDFDKKGNHKGCDLVDGIEAIRSVGFVNTIAIDFVGSGDPIKSVEQAQKILQHAIDTPRE